MQGAEMIEIVKKIVGSEKILVCVIDSQKLFVFTPAACVTDSGIDLSKKSRFQTLQATVLRLVHHLIEGEPKYETVRGSVGQPFPLLTHIVFWFPEQGEFSPEDFVGKVFLLDHKHFTRVQRRAIEQAYKVALQQSSRTGNAA